MERAGLMVLGAATPPAAQYEGFIGWVLSLMSTIGEVGVGLAVLIETFFPPIPSEAVLPGAGFLAYEGRMSFAGALIAATAGSQLGAWCWYAAGAGLGLDRTRALFATMPLVDAEDVDTAVGFFDRWGGIAVFTGRFLPLVRSFISIPAGVARMGLVRFSVYTLAGSAMWNAIWVGLGFAFGPAIQPALERWSGVLSTITVIAMVILLTLFVVLRIRRNQRGETPSGPLSPPDPADARKVIAMANEPAPISFARGAPSLDIIDVDGLRTAADRAFSKDPAGTFAYGTSVGYKPLRSWIAQRHNVSDEQVLVTNGSMQADAFLFEALVAPGDGVVVERPTYDRTLLSLRGREATLHTVELEEDGVDVSAFADLLASGTPVTLAHLIPNFQNPAGYSLSGDKRRALVALAREYGVTIFEDDPYVELRFRGEPEPSMLSLATGGEVVYASSFSKTVCPGIRVGYLVGDAELIAKIAKIATNTYISPSMVSQSIVNEFVRGGAFDSSIETVKGALAERAGLLGQALRRELPEAEFVDPEGGYFLWVTLPEGTDGDALFDAAAERGVAIVKGSDFVVEGGKNAIRLAYSGVTPDQIDEGVARLAQAYRSIA